MLILGAWKLMLVPALSSSVMHFDPLWMHVQEYMLVSMRYSSPPPLAHFCHIGGSKIEAHGA